MKQRVFSMLLCVALLFSVFPQVAFAQGDVLDSGLAANALARTGETYLDWDTNEKKLVPMPIPEGITEIFAVGDIPLSNGWYIVKSTRNVGRVTVSGDVHLILADGCELTARTGIEVNSGSSLTIYAQSDSGSRGKLTATGAENCAGIGGGDGGAGGTITINGGQVTATGGEWGAGIGGGNGDAGGTITINGGQVTATGGKWGAGIGGGRIGAGGTITINGGQVTAKGGPGGAGIGGGHQGACGNIEINHGDVTATGGRAAAGIGSSNQGAGGNIKINGGQVGATGGDLGAGIGGGSNAAGGNIEINGGQVKATGGQSGAGIGGGGWNGAGGNIEINGGEVEATGGSKGAGIGGGDGGAGGIIAITSGQVTATGQDGGKDIGIGNDTTPGENDSVFIDDNATVKNESGKDLSHDPDIIIIHRPDNSRWEFDDTGHWHPCFGCNNPQHRTKLVAHSGGASDCINKAVCDECGQPYGEEHDWSAWKSNNDGTHTRACTRGCGVDETEDCTGTATCDVPQICTECGYHMGDKLNHSWGEWKSNNDGTHTRTCTRGCGADETESCTSTGTATCDVPQTCTKCGYHMGDKLNHSWGEWKSNNDGTHTRACTRGCGVAEEKSCTPALRGQKDPTTDTEGYTGDLVCTLCGWLQKEGQAIPKLPAPREPGGSSSDREPIYHHENFSQGGVVLSGDRIHENARLTVTKDRLHDGGTCSDCDQIRQWQQQGRVIAIYDVSLDHGFRETVTITFPVPGQYNGKTLTIAHCLKGKLEIYETTIQNSKAKVTVDSLSPFVILTGDPAKENPETGGVLPADVPATTEIHTPAAPPQGLARPGTEETTPDAGEPENRASQAAEPAQAASIRQEGAKKAGGGAGIIEILAVLAAVACGGIWFWKRKRSI